MYNATDLNKKTKSLSTVTVDYYNPLMSNPYGYFGEADAELSNALPKIVNLGITSPGFIDNASLSSCKGLDFINTNNGGHPDGQFKIGSITNRELYDVPKQGFASLLKNLKYTYSSLTNDEKKFYKKELENFLKSIQ